MSYLLFDFNTFSCLQEAALLSFLIVYPNYWLLSPLHMMFSFSTVQENSTKVVVASGYFLDGV